MIETKSLANFSPFSRVFRQFSTFGTEAGRSRQLIATRISRLIHLHLSDIQVFIVSNDWIEVMSSEDTASRRERARKWKAKSEILSQTAGGSASTIVLKALSMPTLDEQIQRILDHPGSDSEASGSSEDEQAIKPTNSVIKPNPKSPVDPVTRVRSLSRKRGSRRLEFTVFDDNMEVEPETDASWVVEQQSCTFNLFGTLRSLFTTINHFYIH
jgi:hypothetical protein